VIEHGGEEPGIIAAVAFVIEDEFGFDAADEATADSADSWTGAKFSESADEDPGFGSFRGVVQGKDFLECRERLLT